MEYSEREVYTIEEAAQILKVSQSTIRRWVTTQKLPSSKLGRLHRISGADVQRLLQETKSIKR
jgi:excisionase family DNA binding protein